MSVRSEEVSTTGGTRLAVRVRGSGPALLLCNGWSTSEFFWKHMLPRWETRHTVISWDYPGHGASAPAQAEADVELESLANDVSLVMDAAGVQCATLVGYSMGSQVALEAAARATDRVNAVISLMGSFEHMIGTATHPFIGPVIGGVLRWFPTSASWVVQAGLHRIMRGRAGMPLGRWMGMMGPDARDTDVRDYTEHFGTLHAPSAFAMAAAGQRHSARAALSRIRAPVLIVTGEDDGLAPPARAGELLHALLPGSRLVILRSGTHTSLFEHHEEIAVLVDEFLATIVP